MVWDQDKGGGEPFVIILKMGRRMFAVEIGKSL
jgi:hypothetical protein